MNANLDNTHFLDNLLAHYSILVNVYVSVERINGRMQMLGVFGSTMADLFSGHPIIQVLGQKVL